MKDSRRILEEYFYRYCQIKRQGETSIDMTVLILNSIVGFNKFHGSNNEYTIYENANGVLSMGGVVEILNNGWYDNLIELIEETLLITKLEIILK